MQIATAAAGDKAHEIGSFATGPGVEGEYLTGGDGDGNTLVYAVVRKELAGSERCLDEPVPCGHVSSGAGRRVSDQTARPMPSVPVPDMLDVSVGLVAVAPAQERWQEYDPRVVAADVPVPAAVNGPVEVGDVLTGALQSTFAPRGRVLDLALDRDSTAVLVDTGSALRIERYAVRSGRLIETVRVPDGAQDLDVGSGTVVYRVGNDIWRLTSHRTSPIAHTSVPPIGLSIDGGRIAWAENVGASHAGRIQSVTLR
jgi:hypothetical protein